jgi:predicted regulator of Ras-like GTPase activity (Roadblock/LC7/MglB family)
MFELVQIADLPDVKGAVRGDLAGSFLEAVRERDGEAIAAVTGFVASAMAQAGDELGLGALRRISLSGPAGGCVVAVEGDHVVTARVSAEKAVPAVERFLDDAANGRV